MSGMDEQKPVYDFPVCTRCDSFSYWEGRIKEGKLLMYFNHDDYLVYTEHPKVHWDSLGARRFNIHSKEELLSLIVDIRCHECAKSVSEDRLKYIIEQAEKYFLYTKGRYFR